MISIVRPTMPRAPFAAELAAWIGAGIVGNGIVEPRTPADGEAAIVVVPQYLRAAPDVVLAGLAARDWRGTPVAVAAYGGRDRGRLAVEDARHVLERAGARATPVSLGIDVSAVRRRGFDEADVLLRDLVLDDLAERLRSGRTPARSRPRD